MLLEDFGPLHATRMEARGYSIRTLNQYRLVQGSLIGFLRRALGHEPTLDDLTLDNAVAWQVELQRRPLRQTSINNYTLLCRRWAGWIASYVPKLFPDGNPLADLVAPTPEKTVPHRLTVQEISALLGACSTAPYPERNAALVLLLWDSGLRLSEIIGLRRSDLRLAESGRCGRVEVRSGKGRKQRASGLGERTSDALRAYLKTRQARDMAPEDWLFRARSGPKLGVRGVSIMLKELAHAAGVNAKRVHPHAFRHTFGRGQVRLGTNTLALKDWMGHEHTDTTNRYAQLEAAELEDAFVSLVDHALTGQNRRGSGRRS